MTVKNDISKSLYIALIHRGMTQTDLAAKMGRSKQLINKWFNTGNLNYKNLVEIASALDYSVSDLVSLGEGADDKAVGRAAISKMKKQFVKGE